MKGVLTRYVLNMANPMEHEIDTGHIQRLCLPLWVTGFLDKHETLKAESSSEGVRIRPACAAYP